MFTTLGFFNRAMKMVGEDIEQELGGNVEVTNDKEQKIVTIEWKKNDKTIQALKFQKVYSYAEIDKLKNPFVIAADFIEAYKNPEEQPKVKKVKAAKKVTPDTSEVNPGDSG